MQDLHLKGMFGGRNALAPWNFIRREDPRPPALPPRRSSPALTRNPDSRHRRRAPHLLMWGAKGWQASADRVRYLQCSGPMPWDQRLIEIKYAFVPLQLN